MNNRSPIFSTALRYSLVILGLVFLALIPQIMPSIYWMRILNMALISLICVLGLDISWGLCGQVSLGHAAFYGIGAYTSALLLVNIGLSFWAVLPIVMVVSLIFGAIIGIPTLRLKAQYLALATIGFGEIFYIVMKNWIAFSNGPNGIGNIPTPILFGFKFRNDWTYYYILIVFVLLGLVAYWRIHHSRLGRAMMAVRDSQTAAECMGIPTTRIKVTAFMLAALYAGIAGWLYASLNRYIGPDTFIFDTSIQFLTFDLVGGAGHIAGPIIGSLFLTFLPEWLRFMQLYATAINSMLIVLIMLFKPTGMWGIFRDLYQQIKNRLVNSDKSDTRIGSIS